MTIRRRSTSGQSDSAVSAILSDGSGTQRLRDAENAAAVSRRGVLWRAGLATAAGIGALSLLDAQPAEATTGPFTLGTANTSDAQTKLTATNTVQQFFVIDGSPMGVTDTTMVVTGPNGGRALQ